MNTPSSPTRSVVKQRMAERSAQPRSGAPADFEPLAVEIDVPARLAALDMDALQTYRLQRLRAELRARDYVGALLFDSMNIRYATGSRNMLVWTLHAPGRYAFVATEGPVLLYEFDTCKHLNADNRWITEQRSGRSMFYMFAGSRMSERIALWAADVAHAVREAGGGRRLAVDHCDPWMAAALDKRGLELFDAQEVLEQARRLKSPEEIEAHRISMDVCDLAVRRIKASLRPGVTENQLWSLLQDTNAAHEGEFLECRLLASGPRTNPWFQECGSRPVEAGDLVAFDTDMIGPLNAMSDVSKSYVVPGKKASPHQRELFQLALEQLQHNTALLRPRLSFNDFTARSWKIPARFHANRYMVTVHGVGMCDEWPAVLYEGDQEAVGYDGPFEENMIVSVESYLGAEGGGEGLKLEQQVLITEHGAVPFSKIPIDEDIEID